MAPTSNAFTGGIRSLAILSDLAGNRLASIGSQGSSRAVGLLGWQRAQSYGIQIDDIRTVWHAGHISALLTNGVDVIAANQTGGVWLLSSIISPTPLAGFTGRALTDSIDTPDVTCLAWGANRTQVFVGTSADAMFLLEFETASGHLDFKQSTVLPVDFSTAVSIVVLTNPDRIVVATSFGVWWSPVPGTASNAAAYAWQQAQGLPFQSYTGLAAGPEASVAVAAFGHIYRGTFQGGSLVFTESPITGIDPTLLFTTSLASCEDQPSRMYAIAAGANNLIAGALSSRDGGATWQSQPAPNQSQAGFQGSYNNCIAVSPHRPDVVVVGWLSGGPLFSTDASQTWSHPNTQESNLHLHNDLHAVCFSRNSDGTESLFVGGDGGIAVTSDLGVTYHSQFNRPLNNLQFYGGTLGGNIFINHGGTLTASSRYPGLLAGGTQDNGNVYRCPDTHRPGIPRQADTPWLLFIGGDGDINRFIDPLGLLVNFDNSNVTLGMAVWDDKANRFPPGPGKSIPADDNPPGVAPTSVEIVRNPAFRKNGQLIYAAVGSTGLGLVHGLFAADPVGDHPDARDVKLIRLGIVQDTVTAIGSHGGAAIMVGTTSGKIVSLDSATGAVSPFALPDQASGAVRRIEVFTNPTKLGALPDIAFALVGGRILYFNGLFWATTTGTDWTTFAYDEPTARLFAATDGDVLVSSDRGNTWVDASVGLPSRPHCVDMRIADDGDGGRDLYLATYGHSVWRATIAQKVDVVKVPQESAGILFGVIEDGGGIVRIGNTLVKLPPRPLIRELLAVLAAEVTQQVAKEIGPNVGVIGRTALQQIVDIVTTEIGREIL
jgi:hypothetical protein